MTACKSQQVYRCAGRYENKPGAHTGQCRGAEMDRFDYAVVATTRATRHSQIQTPTLGWGWEWVSGSEATEALCVLSKTGKSVCSRLL